MEIIKPTIIVPSVTVLYLLFLNKQLMKKGSKFWMIQVL